MVSEILITIQFLIVGVSLLLLAVYIYFKKQYKYWESKNVSFGKPTFPFGNMAGINTTSIMNVFKKLYDESKYKRYYGLYIFHKPALMVNDPELIKRILVKDFDHFESNGSNLENISSVMFKDNLFSLEGSKWKNLRTKISPIYSSGKLKMIFPLIVKCGLGLQEALQTSAKMNDEINPILLLNRYLIDVTSSTAFGIDINSIKNPDNEISKRGMRIFESGILKWKLLVAMFLPGLSKMFKISFSSKEGDFFEKLFRDHVDYRQRNNISRNDAMQQLIELLKKGYVNEEEFTFETLVSQAMQSLFAGYETSTRTAELTLYELALNQGIQLKLREEIKNCLARYNGEIVYEAVNEMEYLGRVVDETLRKHPITSLLTRKCTKEFKDPGSDLIIDKNTYILISSFGHRRDERYYPNPEKFDPDRFTKEAKESRSNYTYLPFGDGPRICIGQRIALLQIKVAIIAIISKFHLKRSDKFTPTSIEFEPRSLIAVPKGKIILKISIAD